MIATTTAAAAPATASKPADPPSVPAYLLHAPFLSLTRPHDPSHPSLLIQRTLPPSPLYYLYPAPPTPPGSLPPALVLDDAPPIETAKSKIYRAHSPSGARVVLKYSTDFMALMHEAEEVFVNLPSGLGIPTYWGLFQGAIEEGQAKALVLVLEDCGEPLEGGFEALSKEERRKLYDTLAAFHSIHFQHGNFSPSSIVVRPASSSANPSSTPRKITLAGFSKAEWHLCPGADSCKELVDARRALGLEEEKP
ncbi:hypothetical protein JCM8547_005614 [Rhodosporidiobolus lusitaniae]